MSSYAPIPPAAQIGDDFLKSLARKGFVMANLPPQKWPHHWDDCKQIAFISLMESEGKAEDRKRITRAKYRVFEYVLDQVYKGGLVGNGRELEVHPLFPELVEENDDFEMAVEWEMVWTKLSEVLPDSLAKIAYLLLVGKSNHEIADTLGLSSEDSARALVSRTRRHIQNVLEEME